MNTVNILTELQKYIDRLKVDNTKLNKSLCDLAENNEHLNNEISEKEARIEELKDTYKTIIRTGYIFFFILGLSIMGFIWLMVTIINLKA